MKSKKYIVLPIHVESREKFVDEKGCFTTDLVASDFEILVKEGQNSHMLLSAKRIVIGVITYESNLP